jgi:type VI secretion system protein ImpM
MENSASIPGWFGKVPFLGDFASRRLPPSFISVWDEWLQRCIVASKNQLGEQWTDIYLHAPIWRFMLWPDVIGETGWAGILMPSVDNAGRYFPLTFAAQITPHSENFSTLIAAQNWFEALEHIALTTLDVNFSVENLETALANKTSPCVIAPEENTPATALSQWLKQPMTQNELLAIKPTQEISMLFSEAAIKLFSENCVGRSLWWQDHHEGPASLYWINGLPPNAYFSALLHGEIISDAAISKL